MRGDCMTAGIQCTAPFSVRHYSQNSHNSQHYLPQAPAPQPKSPTRILIQAVLGQQRLQRRLQRRVALVLDVERGRDGDGRCLADAPQLLHGAAVLPRTCSRQLDWGSLLPGCQSSSGGQAPAQSPDVFAGCLSCLRLLLGLSSSSSPSSAPSLSGAAFGCLFVLPAAGFFFSSPAAGGAAAGSAALCLATIYTSAVMVGQRRLCACVERSGVPTGSLCQSGSPRGP